MSADKETEEQLNLLLHTICKDSTDGELAFVEAVDTDSEQLFVQTKEFIKRGSDNGEWWASPDDFTEVYDEHVIGENDIWQLQPGDRNGLRTNPAFVGAEVEIIALDLDHVTFKYRFFPLAADSKKVCRLMKPSSEKLETFLDRFNLLAKQPPTGDYVPGGYPYESTADDLAAFEKTKEEVRQALKNGAPPPDVAELLVAQGLATQDEINQARKNDAPPPAAEALKRLLELLGQLPKEAASEDEEAEEDDEDEDDDLKKSLGMGASDSGSETHGDTNQSGKDTPMTDTNTAKTKKMKADDFKDVRIRNEGNMIVLPSGMTKKVAIEWITRLDKEDERVVRIFHEIQAYPIEGAYALYRALQTKYGFTSLQSTPNFFGEEPPMMVGLDISTTERAQAPWGRIGIPGISGFLETSANLKPDGSFRFILSGEVKRRDEQEANELVHLVRQYATEKSIYKGKAVRVRFPESKKDFDITYLPTFIDTSRVNPQDLVFPKEVDDLVNVALFSPIEKTDLCRRLHIPLKRGILLEGPFGTGKTLTAYVTAKKCEENGWTFMYLDKTSDLRQAIMLARNYQPCVIFAEDIDRALAGEARDAKMDEILNTIDGIDGKSTEILVVLTTNNVEDINRAMLRPGRLDAVIPVRAPDARAAARLVNNYSSGLLKATEEEMAPVGKALEGFIPAVIREVVERAKLAAIYRLPAGAEQLDLRPEDLLRACDSMKSQLDLMRQKVEDKREPIEKAAGVLGEAVLAAAVALKRVEDRAGSKPNGESHLPVAGVEA